MNFDEVMREIEAVARGEGIALSEAQLKTVGEEAIAIIVDRTKTGIDADHAKFDAYSPDYAKFREAHSRSSEKVDLAFTGAMQGAMQPVVTGDSVEIGFMSTAEEKKAEWHTHGYKKTVPVKTHARTTHINTKTGQRVSAKEAAKDKRRKVKRTEARTETVNVHERNMKLPKRDFFDIRHPKDEARMSEVVGEMYAANIAKRRR